MSNVIATKDGFLNGGRIRAGAVFPQPVNKKGEPVKAKWYTPEEEYKPPVKPAAQVGAKPTAKRASDKDVI